MMPRLTSLTVENFRSIRGNLHVSLDAPVVLIHGPNGTGKTSLLSAIELGLTNQIASFDRVDPQYFEHLPHKDAQPREGRVALTIAGLSSATSASLTVDGSRILGAAALSPNDARFFVERCYLAQSTISRLLEIYQHQDARRSDSPLTRFVKELLGLERFDALIDGLATAGHVSRLRIPVPDYWSAREQIPILQTKIKDATEAVETAKAELGSQGRLFLDLAGPEAQPFQTLDTTALAVNLATTVEEDERLLIKWARYRRDLASALEQVLASNAAGAENDREAAKAELDFARDALQRWREREGQELAVVVDELQRDYSDVPGVEPDATAAQKSAFAIVTSELARVQRALDTDADEGGKLADLRASIRQGDARIKGIDLELAEAVGANEELARALSAIVPHINEEICPVCERDFREVSRLQPLAAQLSERIAELVSAAGRLQSLTRDKSMTTSSVSAAQGTAAELESRQLTDERRDELKIRLARLNELEQRLEGLMDPAAIGSDLQGAVSRAAQRLATFGSRDASIEGLHGLAIQIAAELEEAYPAESEQLEEALTRLQDHVKTQETLTTERQRSRRRATSVLAEITRLQSVVRAMEAEGEELRLQHERLSMAKAEADRRVELAKDLVRQAREVRTSMVRKVFNNDLNALWRELFIRLAPEEAFVPAFALPSSTAGPVEAVLETLYRSGGKGGNPRAMLSAGNLNTAALTLFLALNLSVRPQLPWLIIDDPVQSMDEVHIAQFAALLRSLKQTGRQVIIAVHERSLFEYLTLELSPTYLDDRLITVELGRGPDGMTVAPWSLRTFQPDRAVAA